MTVLNSIKCIASCKNIYPAYKEASVGDEAQFSCKSYKMYLVPYFEDMPYWMFNKNLDIPDDINRQNHSIIINNVKLHHSGTYRCYAQQRQAWFKRHFYCVSSATLKVFGKCSINNVLL